MNLMNVLRRVSIYGAIIWACQKPLPLSVLAGFTFRAENRQILRTVSPSSFCILRFVRNTLQSPSWNIDGHRRLAYGLYYVVSKEVSHSISCFNQF